MVPFCSCSMSVRQGGGIRKLQGAGMFFLSCSPHGADRRRATLCCAVLHLQVRFAWDQARQQLSGSSLADTLPAERLLEGMAGFRMAEVSETWRGHPDCVLHVRQAVPGARMCLYGGS